MPLTLTNKNMKLTFLGTGTSTGVPVIGCKCNVCTNDIIFDKRLRCAALLQINDKNILIDAGPDIRTQLLKEHVTYINSILITHSHVDHILGLDEFRTFTNENIIDLYANINTFEDIKRIFSYLFNSTNIQLGGGLTRYKTQIISNYKSFNVFDTLVEPLLVMHGKLPITGYKIGNLAYLTDVKTLPLETIKAVQDIDVLVLSCLRIREHGTHLNLKEMLELVVQINPKITYLIHMDHEHSHLEWQTLLPKNVFVAYDGLTIEIKE